MKKIVFVIFVLGLVWGGLNFALAPAFADLPAGQAGATAGKQDAVEVIYFWGNGCPHCAKEKIFLDKLEKKYPELGIKRYEVWYSQENQKLFAKTAKELDITQLGVPLTIIKDKYFIGYRDDETTGKEIEDYLKSVLSEIPLAEASEGKGKIKLPFFGETDLSRLSLPVLAITLGAVDGFNPCAMWILLFLIALLINTKSRKKIWLIGGTFIAASGLFYFLVLAAWLNLFLAIGYLYFIRLGIGLFALGFGFWQLREFIYYQPGICKVLGLKPKLQQKLTQKAEKIVSSPLTLAMIGGLILLAISVNLIEFFCSAGLPAIFTGILSFYSLNTFSYYFYLLLYTFIFMLDDLIVFSLAIITLRKAGFTEKYNRWSALIGGLLILILGILLIFRPELLMFG